MRNGYFILLLLLLCGNSCTDVQGDGRSRGDRNKFFDDLANSGYDLQIIDYSQNGDDGSIYTRGDVEILRARGNSLVAGVVSLGVAETNRFYWRTDWDANSDGLPDSTAPQWLVRQLSPGKWQVRYWDAGWLQIVAGVENSLLTRILQAGYSGVYLTGFDSWKLFPTVPDAEMRMKQFALAIADSFHVNHVGFVIGQNLGALSRFPEIVSTYDGAAQDEMFYGYNKSDGLTVPDEIRIRNIASLAPFGQAGKPMLAIDYPFTGSPDRTYFDEITMGYISEGRNIARSNGMLHYPSVRNINDLTLIPGSEPTLNSSPVQILSQVSEFCIQLHPGPQ